MVIIILLSPTKPKYQLGFLTSCSKVTSWTCFPILSSSEYHTYPPSSVDHCAVACASNPTARVLASVWNVRNWRPRGWHRTIVSVRSLSYRVNKKTAFDGTDQSTPKLTDVDSIYIAKHKNGKYYLRVVINNYGRSVIFFLSKEETRAYLLAADAMERERLKQQIAFKYLLRASGGSYDHNREWEVGRGQYDSDDGQKWKMWGKESLVKSDSQKT